MTDYVTDFVQESEERITELNNALLTLERDPTDDEAMDEIFRVAHTLKGNCGAMGLDSASDLAHAIEDVLDAVRTDDLEVTSELMDVIFDAVDELETMIDEVAADGEIDTDPSATIEALREQLEAGTDPETIRTPTTDEIDAVIERFDPPADDEHHAYLVRLGIVDRDDVNNGKLVLDALIDAFDLIGTEPPRDEIEAGDAGSQFDAVFGSAVGEAAIASGLEPVEEVADFELVDVSDRFEARADAAADEAESASGPGAGISSEDAADLEVDDLLDEFEEFDNLDEMVEDVEDDELEAFENMGEAGSFDDLLDEEDLDLDTEPDVATEDSLDEDDLEADETDADAGSAAEPADDDVDDANAVFNELKDEVEMVGFDELQAELDELEFDEFDNDDEVGMDELLGDDVDVEDDSFLEGEPSEDAVDDILYDGDDESTDSIDAEAAMPDIDEESTPDDPGVADLADGTELDDDLEDDGPVAVGPVDEDDLEDTLVDDDEPADEDGLEDGPLDEDDPVGEDDFAVAGDSGGSTADADDALTADAADELEPPTVDGESDAVGSDDESDPVAVAEEPDDSVSAVESDDSAEAADVDDSVADGTVAESATGDSTEEVVAADTTEEPVVDDSPEESVADDSSEESDWDESDESVDVTDEDDAAESFETEFEDEFASSPAVDSADEETETVADDDPFADDSLVDDDPFADDEFADGLEFGGTDESFDAETADDLEDDAFDDAFADDEFDDPFADDDFADDDFADEFDESDAESTEPVDSDAGSFGDHRAEDDDADDGVVRRVVEPSFESPSLSIPETTDRPDADQQTDEIQSVRVDVEQIDSLLTLVEGLVTSRVRLRHAATEGEETGALETELDDLEDLTTDLQETVMDIRLVPLQTVTNRLPRVVRDIAREQDKEVAFEMTGEDVELDRSILDRIGDPLIHLVRNAVDHGIEPPAERGDDKPREGSVEVHADRARDRVTITVEDDGSGLDPDRLRSEAVDADIITEAEADDLSDDEAYELIFHPGLSTADEVTDVSGRGVGMDVVKRTVEDLEGTISIDSEIGAGTTVTMTLPVTVAIDDILFVESGGEEFGVPTKAVQDIEPAEGLETVEGRPALPDAEDYSVVRLDETLETPRRGVDGDGMIVRIRGDVRPVALHCDHVHGQQEVVVKPFEGFMSDIPGLSGATVRGRGEVVNILDVTTL